MVHKEKSGRKLSPFGIPSFCSSSSCLLSCFLLLSCTSLVFCVCIVCMCIVYLHLIIKVTYKVVSIHPVHPLWPPEPIKPRSNICCHFHFLLLVSIWKLGFLPPSPISSLDLSEYMCLMISYFAFLYLRPLYDTKTVPASRFFYPRVQSTARVHSPHPSNTSHGPRPRGTLDNNYLRQGFLNIICLMWMCNIGQVLGAK